ncbi:MAG: DUF3500 domain-containing protein [Ginsengibacter sp.]
MTTMFIKPSAIILFLISISFLSCSSQSNNTNIHGSMSAVANDFLAVLSAEQKAAAKFSFDEQEKYNWHYIPKSRKGISLGELDDTQKRAAFNLLRTALSAAGYNKAIAVMKLEAVLKEAEGRLSDDNYRDSGKYYFSIFGNPATDSIWGWRLEGHHVSFNFSTKDNKLVSGTPGFIGANPAIVLAGPEKGKQVLKDETELGLTLLHSLNTKQMETAIISDKAPGDIITAASRKAMISDPKGILYSELTGVQQKDFLQLLSIYIHRYTTLFAMDMMHEIEEAGLNNLRFAWAGSMQSGPGNPTYYRIQGPTIIIEYDNTQNNANHVHTVVRDLKNDFGGDELLEHYKQGHHN